MDGRDAKPLPSSIESEQAILGSIILDNDLIQTVAECLEAGDFYSPMHRRVFNAMIGLYHKQRSIDPILICEELKKDGADLEAIGGVHSVTNLAFGIPHAIDITEYVETVRQAANKRQLIRLCSQIAQSAYDGDHDEVFDAAQAKINDLCVSIESGGSSSGTFLPLAQIIDNEVMQVLDDLRHGRTIKIKTGFPAIDEIVGGVAPSDVVLIAADTGRGKSALALQMAYQFAINGYPSAFLAGEMTNKENVLRLLSQLAQVTNLNSTTYLSDAEYNFLVQWAQHIRSSPIHFEHRISDMQTLGTHLRSVVQRQKVKVLVIDYIQLFKMEQMDRRKRNERIAECSQEVKRLANELGIAIIEVAQFNREGAKSVQAGLHDLEGSGQLEKDASMIFILETSDEEFRLQDGRKYHDAKIRVVKGRNVGRSEINGRFFGRSVQFEFGT